MLDTLKLLVHDFEVKDSSCLQVQLGSYKVSGSEVIEHPLFKTDSHIHYGSKAYLNEDNWNLTIKPVRDGSIGAYLSFSIPKNYYGDNYYSVGEQGSKAVIGKLEKELEERGIGASLQDADLSRVDTFKNIEPEEPFSSYHPLFNTLQVRRAVKRNFGTTFLSSNTQQEHCIYDKLEEMKNLKKPVAGLPNTMRFEHRLLSKRKVADTYGFTKVKDLFKGGYEVVREKQMESWRESLFQYEVDEVIALGSKQIEQEMRAFWKLNNTRWLDSYLKAYGAYSLVAVAGIDAVLDAIKSIERDNRMKVHRLKNTLLEAQRTMMMNKQGKDKTLGNLYVELKEKVLNG